MAIAIPCHTRYSALMETIYEQLVKADVPIEDHGLYFHALVTRESRAIIEKSGLQASVFYSKADHQAWFLISSTYSPRRGK